MEKWKPISFAPIYEVSNMGRIRNIRTKKVLKPRAPRWNHKQETVFLYRSKFFHEQYTISQIVYNHWCLKDGEPPTHNLDYNTSFKVKGNRVGHYDGNISNNRMENLYRY